MMARRSVYFGVVVIVVAGAVFGLFLFWNGADLPAARAGAYNRTVGAEVNPAHPAGDQSNGFESLSLDHYLLLNQPSPLWLRGIDLAGADLRRIALRGVDLSRANLARTDLRESLLLNGNLDDARLVEADLMYAVLSGASLRRVDFSSASLVYTALENADLSHAILAATDLSGANLTGARLEGVTWTGARYSADTVWPEAFDPALTDADFVGEGE